MLGLFGINNNKGDDESKKSTGAEHFAEIPTRCGHHAGCLDELQLRNQNCTEHPKPSPVDGVPVADCNVYNEQYLRCLAKDDVSMAELERLRIGDHGVHQAAAAERGKWTDRGIEPPSRRTPIQELHRIDERKLKKDSL